MNRRDISHRAAFETNSLAHNKLLAERTDQVGREARAYLYEMEVNRQESDAKQRDAREMETLKLARRANMIAIISVVVAVLASIVAAFK
ncbi:hypothetical protein D8I35_05315 [Corticibacter populi]|uniref:Uncharacterized protein n=1 Tax=Corticibacter populi TaxID=1550736 RepID=A0A3M6QZQ6_9BURK|nr:hypothetical protein D8I35_05315 [Corticibacter populi]RZS35810.1 hypothetical protein EV687_0889 [Corticibacter populi]